MNQEVFLAINGLAGKSHLVDGVGVFLAGKFIYLFGLIILALWFKKTFRNRVYLAIASAFVSRVIIVEFIKRIVNYPRPYETVPGIHQLLADNEHGMSFPSGHTVIFFAFAFAFYGTRFFWPFLIFAVLGSLARIFVGVHYPADILVGAIIGAIVSLSLLRLFKKPGLS
jgi:undecaprenyl-diphosphatase